MHALDAQVIDLSMSAPQLLAYEALLLGSFTEQQLYRYWYLHFSTIAMAALHSGSVFCMDCYAPAMQCKQRQFGCLHLQGC